MTTTSEWSGCSTSTDCLTKVSEDATHCTSAFVRLDYLPPLRCNVLFSSVAICVFAQHARTPGRWHAPGGGDVRPHVEASAVWCLPLPLPSSGPAFAECCLRQEVGRPRGAAAARMCASPAQTSSMPAAQDFGA
eukprot:6185044-Pleurochrysis_carterae.AAC.2